MRGWGDNLIGATGAGELAIYEEDTKGITVNMYSNIAHRCDWAFIYYGNIVCYAECKMIAKIMYLFI